MTPERWKEIDEIVQAALERRPEERSAFLDQACSDDQALRREVEALISYESQASGFLEKPAFEGAAEAIAGDQYGLSSGSALGQYRIERRIGAGGMGEVYLAQDTRLGRRVALKILPKLPRSSDSCARFLREAQLASALDHPNVCTIHEIAEASGYHFIAMQYVEGKTLKEVIGKQPLDLDKVLSISLQVGDALRAAHAQGIIHRDIKSSNIIITARGQAKVLDFGLAKSLERASTAGASATQLTDTGVPIGTPAYMSPEQARGNAADHRSDIFSFGAVLYEMATGSLPFTEESQIETMNSIIHKQHVPAIALNEKLSVGFSSVIDRAMAKRVVDRYQSIEDVMEALRSCAPGAGLASSQAPDGIVVPYSVPQRRPTFLRVKRYVLGRVGVTVAAIVLTLIVAFYLVWMRPHSPPAAVSEIKSMAVLPLKPLEASGRDESLEMGMAETLITRLNGLSHLVVRPISAVRNYTALDTDPLAAGKQMQVEAVLYGHIQRSGEQIRITMHLVRIQDGAELWSAKLDDAYANIFSMQDSISEKLVSALSLRLSGQERERLTRHYTEKADAYQAYMKGRFWWNKRDEEGFHKAIDYFNEAIALDPGYALPYAGLADCYVIMSPFSLLAPQESYKKAKAAVTKALEIDDQMAEARTSLAHLTWMYEWNWPEAEREFSRALELNPNYATAHQWYSVYLSAMGRHEEAIAEAKRAHEIDSLSLPIIRDMARAYYHARQYDQAIASYMKALELDPHHYRYNSWLEMAYAQIGDYDQAVDAHLKALNVLRVNPKEIAGLGIAYKRLGWEGFWRKELELARKQPGQPYFIPYNLARISARIGDREQTFKWLEKAYAQHSDHLVLLKVDPIFDALRSDQRFRDLIGLVGLPQ